MRKIALTILCVIAVVGLLSIRNTYSADPAEPCDHNCAKCHEMTSPEAQGLLKEAIPDVKIIEVRPFPFKGVWEVAFESKGRKGIVYIDFSKKLLLSGAIFNIATKANLTQERQSELNKVDVSQIPLGDALVLGDKDAKYRVIVFDDPS